MIRSESLRRLHVEQPPRHYATDDRRAELQSQVDEFLAAGGKIETLPSNMSSSATFALSFGKKGKT